MSTFRFGVFELDLHAGELRKQGVRIRLQDQPLLILQALLERAGTLVTREELKARIWPADTFVDFDHGLNSAMKRLRDALGDTAENPRFIETQPRHGYRFVAAVEKTSLPSPESTVTPVQLPTSFEDDKHEPVPKSRGKAALVSFVALSAVVALIFALHGGAMFGWLGGQHPARSLRSLAVLPLANLSSDPTKDYFADEMTEELITQFSKIGDLKVISRTSVMQYKGTRKSLPQTARELGVNLIVEGAVQLSGNRVRITAHLVDATTDRYLWAEDYDRDLKDILLLQSEVAQDIAKKVEIKLTPEQKERFARQIHPVDPEAYDAYLRGRYYWNKRTADGLKKSGEYFQKAIERDPNYAIAYSGLADYYAFLTLLGGPEIMPPRDAMTKAKAAAARALELDSSLAEAHASMGHVLHNYDWDWSEAEREFKRAIDLSPNYSIVHHWYAHLLMQQGRVQESLAEARRALELDPLSLFINNGLARQYYLSHQYNESVAQCEKALEIDSGYLPARMQLGLALEQQGMIAEAIRQFEQARDQAANYAVTAKDGDKNSGSPSATRLPVVHAMLGYAYAKDGRLSDARNELQTLRATSRVGYVSPSYFAIIYIGLGDNDNAFAWLEKSYQDRSEHILYLKAEPLVNPLRGDARFESLLKRVGLRREIP